MAIRANFKEVGEELSKLPKAFGDAAKSFGKTWFGIGKEGSSAVGGLLGGAVKFAGGIIATAGNILGKTTRAAFAAVERFPVVAGIVAAVVGYKAFKGWSHDRDTKHEIAQEEARRDLLKAGAENIQLRGAVAADMPENPNARGGHLDAQLARKTAAQGAQI